MQQYNSGDIVLLLFPFADVSGSKRRPALVLLDTNDEDIIVARVTGQPIRTTFDVEVIEWQQAGLRLPSIVRVNKIATLEKRLIERRLGALMTTDWARVREKIRLLWASV